MYFKNSNFIGGPNPLNNINLDSLIIINPLITVEELQELNCSMSNTILFMVKKKYVARYSQLSLHIWDTCEIFKATFADRDTWRFRLILSGLGSWYWHFFKSTPHVYNVQPGLKITAINFTCARSTLKYKRSWKTKPNWQDGLPLGKLIINDDQRGLQDI